MMRRHRDAGDASPSAGVLYPSRETGARGAGFRRYDRGYGPGSDSRLAQPMRHPDLGTTIELMRRAHEGQIDKSGQPHYLHALRVAMRVASCSAAERHAALLHDVVEDTVVSTAFAGTPIRCSRPSPRWTTVERRK
jgi:hypothetical protein